VQLTFLGKYTKFENFAPEYALRRLVSSVPLVTVDAAALRNNLAVVAALRRRRESLRPSKPMHTAMASCWLLVRSPTPTLLA
jgi:hypothetical protein